MFTKPAFLTLIFLTGTGFVHSVKWSCLDQHDVWGFEGGVLYPCSLAVTITPHFSCFLARHLFKQPTYLPWSVRIQCRWWAMDKKDTNRRKNVVNWLVKSIVCMKGGQGTILMYQLVLWRCWSCKTLAKSPAVWSVDLWFCFSNKTQVHQLPRGEAIFFSPSNNSYCSYIGRIEFEQWAAFQVCAQCSSEI